MSEKDKDKEWMIKEVKYSLLEYEYGKIQDLFYHNGLNIEKIIPQTDFFKNNPDWFPDLITIKDYQNVIREILGFDNWDDYKKERNKIYNNKKQKERTKKRRDSGYTEKLRREYLEKFNYKCILCHSEKRPEIHHLDGNPYNNTENNLCILCNQCHKGITKFYKILKHRNLEIINLEEIKNDQEELEKR